MSTEPCVADVNEIFYENRPTFSLEYDDIFLMYTDCIHGAKTCIRSKVNYFFVCQNDPLYFSLIIFINTLPDTRFYETGLLQFEEESSYTKNGSKGYRCAVQVTY